MSQDQFTIERDERQYHADLVTVTLLEAAKQYDDRQPPTAAVAEGEARMQDIAFEHAYDSGRILDGPAPQLTRERGREQLDRDGHVEMRADRVRELYGKEPRFAVAEGNVYINQETNQYRALTPEERKDFQQAAAEDHQDRLQAHHRYLRYEV